MNYYYLVITIFLIIVSIYIYNKATFSNKKPSDFPIFTSNVIVPNPNNLLIWIQPKNAPDSLSWNNSPAFKPFGKGTSSPTVNNDNSITFTDTSVTTFILKQIVYYLPNYLSNQVNIIIANLDGTSPITINIISLQTQPNMGLQIEDIKPIKSIPIDSTKSMSLELKSDSCNSQGCYAIDTIVGLIFEIQ